MKSALLLPGHMRAYKKTFVNQLETIIKPNNCDIYISTSTTNTIVNGNNITSVKLNMKNMREEIKNFYGDLLKGVVIEEETQEDVQKSIRDYRPDRSKQWLRLQQCNQMAKDSVEKYDFIIRSRTDLVFNCSLEIKNEMDKAVCLMKHFDSKIPIHDQFAFGTPDLMDVYCGLYNVWVPRVQGGRSEEQLYKWLISQEIPLHFLQSLKFQMVRGV